MTAAEYIETIRHGKIFCADSGFCRKTHKRFRRLADNDRREIRAWIRRDFPSMLGLDALALKAGRSHPE